MTQIPDALRPVLDQHRGTGRLTVGAVDELVRRWRFVEYACSMCLLDWINKSASRFHGSGKSDFVDENIDFWIDSWRMARKRMAYVSRKNADMLKSVGIVLPVEGEPADFLGDGTKFDVVKFNF